MTHLPPLVLALVVAIAGLAAPVAAETLGKCKPDPQGSSSSGLDFGDCDWPGYIKSRIVLPAIPLALGIVVLVGFPFFLCCRRCCCRSDPEEATGRGCLRAATLCAFGIGCGGAALLFVGSAQAHTQYKEMFDGLEAAPRYILESIDLVQACVQGTVVEGQVREELDKVRDTTTDFQSKIKDARTNADKVEKSRNTATPAVGAVSCMLLFLLLLLSSGWCVRRCPCENIASTFFFTFAALLLIVCGVCAIVYVIADDTCPELDKQITNNPNDPSVFAGFVNQSCDGASLDSAKDLVDTPGVPENISTCVDDLFSTRDLDDCVVLFNKQVVQPQVSTCSHLTRDFKILVAGIALLASAMLLAGVLVGCAFKRGDRGGAVPAEYANGPAYTPVAGYDPGYSQHGAATGYGSPHGGPQYKAVPQYE